MMHKQDTDSKINGRSISYAVVFKTYAWDEFVHRQAQRCAAVTGHGDFYVSVDETNGSVGPIPFERVVRTNCTDMMKLGLANRFERGSLLWWNADFAHYQFYNLHPEYDFYVFVEYDAVAQIDLDKLIEQLAAREIDYVSLPIRENKEEWAWTVPHRQVYAAEEVEGTLICISIQSQRALRLLFERRLEMSVAPGPPYWPLSEVFMPTEIKRAGYNMASLDEFGDVTHYDWFPPMLERSAVKQAAPAFLHPVYDSGRYLRRTKANRPDIWMLLDRKNPISRTLLRRHPVAYSFMVTRALAVGIKSTLTRHIKGPKDLENSTMQDSRL